MRKLMIAGLMLAAAGCTPPTVKVGMRAIERGTQQTDAIVRDLAMLAAQASVDRAAQDVVAAVRAGDEKAAVAAVETLATDLDKVRWEQSEYVKARWGLFGVAEMALWQQQGIGSIWWEEWDRARAATQQAP